MSLQFTDAGLNRVLSENAKGLMGELTTIAVGSGKYTPTPTMTHLIDEKQRAEVADKVRVQSGQYRIGFILDGNLEYAVGEIGYFLRDGTLLAVESSPDTVITYKSASSTIIPKFLLDLRPMPANGITVVAGTEHINLFFANEFETIAKTLTDSMSRDVEAQFRLTEIETRLSKIEGKL